MANSSDFRDDDVTLPGGGPASARAGLEPTLMAHGAEPELLVSEAAGESLAETLDAALSPEELAALEAPPLPDPAPPRAPGEADEVPTLRRPPGAMEPGLEPTARRPGAGRTWAFGDGITLDAENVGSPRVVGASALDALLADIERSFAGAADSVTPGPLIGHANRFQLTSRLGHGGMGVVFRAFDHELRRYIAIKLLAPSQLGLSEGGVDHFLRNEARAIAALSHPNIVQVFDISFWCEVPFLVMEYLEGRSLDELPAEPMPLPHVLAVADQLLSALEHAHEHGVIHRDLKPSNLFETTRGELKILDFGIASLGDGRARDGAPRRRAGDDSAVAAAISGTPGYMSPEQWISPVQDERTDLWAVGVLLVGMLTGRPLFAERSASEVRAEVLSERPTLVERDYRIPRPLFRVLEKALEKDPERRYQTAAALRQALADAGVALGLSGRARISLAPEQRQVTLISAHLSIDAVGDFETAAEILRTWHNTVGAIVQRAGGFVMISAGARVVACFGYPAAQEDDAVRAVSVACAIRDSSGDLLRPGARRAKVRVGVDTGLGVIEEVPVSAGGVPMFHGPAAQSAMALRERAEVDQVVIGVATAELVRGYFIATELAAGPGGAEAYVVTSARAVTSRFDASLQEAALLVGRDDELEIQDRLWQEASTGQGSVYCLVGDAGVGKSRLVHRLRQRVIAEGGLVLTGQCWSQTAQSPFHPLIALLRQALELDAAAAGVTAQLARLQRVLIRLGLEEPRDAAVLAAVLGLPAPEGAPAPAESAEALRRAIIDRATVLLERLAARTPVALIIEDLHWADHSTLDFLDHLLPRVVACRLVLVLTARREAEPFWRQRAQCHERELCGLPPEVARELVRHLHSRLGHAAPSAELVEEIVAKSSGLPLYLEELTRAYAQRPVSAVGGAVAPPATLLGLLGARLDQASAAARAAAQLGAVLGRDFRLELLEPLVLEQPLTGEARERSGPVPVAGRASTSSGVQLAELESALAELCERGIIQPASSAQGSYGFRHALMHDVAYQTMPPELRRGRHAQVAELLVRWSEQPAAGRPEPLAVSAELVAYHYDQAGRAEVAVQYWERAGQAAAKKWAVKEAVGHLSRALVLLETLPQTPARAELELRLLLALGPPLMSVQGYAAPRVEDTYARAYELCLHQGRHAQTFPPLVGLWQYNMVGGNLGKAALLGSRLLTLAEAVGDSTMKLIAMRAIGTTSFLQGDLGAAIEHTRAGWKLYDRAAHGELAFRHGNDPGVGHGIYLAWALWQAGYPDQALAQAQATLALARSLAHPMSIAFSLCYSAIIRNLRGEHAEAEQLLAEALVVAEDNQLGLWKALALIQRGWATAARGDAAGVDTMIAAIAAWRQTGARAGTTFFYVVLGQAQDLHGQRDAAAESYQAAAALARQNGEHFYEPELARAQAALLEPASHAPQISELLERALEQARRQASRSWELRLHGARLELALVTGAATPQAAEARAALAGCLASFSEGHATADLRHAAALLERADGQAS